MGYIACDIKHIDCEFLCTAKTPFHVDFAEYCRRYSSDACMSSSAICSLQCTI